ncbi:hypothetical protein M9H77_20376 [Catharanthus roseus]|uniref:Uncharacterized protein n=1 Tax=Catharanthus roseus TaxID=4058 RepID=A0ACC0AM72_CATRO|nr:hypothetical protein M9H77_20376 [Catharanthus roseus]
MSVFGGDSWAREAQFRKRRVDDLIIEGINSSAYKKLPNGKFSCLVCPQRPLLDSPLMLSTHMKGSRHRAAESKLKERELAIQDERNKRIALSGRCSSASESLFTQGKGTPEVGAVSTVIAGQEEFNLRERRERELKFTAAGWKRDCHGRWFKDENVEFDSDEEDPNVCLGL